MDDMKAAVTAVREKKLGYLKASKQFNVPRSTLFRFVNEKETSIEDLLNKKIGRKPVFNEKFENELVEYALKMENTLYGLTKTDMRRIAFQFAAKSEMPNPFKNNIAGRYWLDGFLKRHKDILSMRKPQEPRSQEHVDSRNNG